MNSIDRLRLADSLDLTLELRVPQLLFGDVGGVLDHLEGIPVEIQDRVVGRLDPDLLAALADALVLGGLILAPVQRLPKLAVLDARLGYDSSTNMRWCWPWIFLQRCSPPR